jgi:phage I-like protein
MKMERCILQALVLSDDAAGDDAAEFQILKTGKFKHKVYGTFEITPDMLKSFKDNFDNRVLGIDVQMNYDHCLSVAHGTKAAGWIRALSIKANGNELWATPEWTPEASKGIKDKEWKYSSAEITPRWEHPEKGSVHKHVLLGVALTNTPFIKGMERIAASEIINHKESKKMELHEIEGMLLSEHKINLATLRSDAGKVAGLESQVKNLSEQVKDSVKALGEATAQVEDLTKKLSVAESAANEVKLNALIERGMKEGKLTKAFAEGAFKQLADKMGLEFAEKTLNEMPKVIDVEEGRGHGGGSNDEGKGTKKFKTPDLEVAAKAQELMDKDAKLLFRDAIDQVFAADSDLAKRYQSWEGEGADATT